MRQALRYLFWFSFCAVFCYSLAQDRNGITGPIIYGGGIGLGFAAATDTRWTCGTRFRMSAGALWIVTMTAFFVWIFRPVSHAWDAGVVLWGLLFSFPPPLIWIVQRRGWAP